MEKQGNLPRIRIRISRKIGKECEHGKWHSASTYKYLWMRAAVAQLNEEHGPGTHWIEEKPQRKKPRIHKTLHGDYVCFCEAVAGYAPTLEVAYADWKRAMRRYASPGYWEKYFPNERQ